MDQKIVNLSRLLCLRHYYLESTSAGVEPKNIILGRNIVDLYKITITPILSKPESYFVNIESKSDKSYKGYQIYESDNLELSLTINLLPHKQVYTTPHFIVQSPKVVSANAWYVEDLYFDQLSSSQWVDFGPVSSEIKAILNRVREDRELAKIALNEIPCNILARDGATVMRVGEIIVFYRRVKGLSESYRIVQAVLKPRG